MTSFLLAPHRLHLCSGNQDASSTRVPSDAEGKLIFHGHSEARRGEIKIGGAVPIRLLAPILLRHSVDVKFVEIIHSSGLLMSEISVTHVVVTRCRHRSIPWRVSMTLFLAALRVVILSLSTLADIGTSLLLGIRQDKKAKIMLQLSHDVTDILPRVPVLHVGRVLHVICNGPSPRYG